MPYINEVGEFQVTLGMPRFEKLEEKDGDGNRMVLVIPCHTREDPSRHLDFPYYFTRKLIGSGSNAGKPMYQLAMENVIKLGMSEPFHPSKIGELEGKEASLVTTEDEYTNSKGDVVGGIKGLFLNGRRRPQLTPDKAAEVWKTFESDGTIEAEGNQDDLPDIPF